MKSGNSAGTAKISFSMKATQLSDCVGVSAIKVYTLDGDYVTTIKGTTGNGLLAQNCRIHSGSYTYYGRSGISYYAVVTTYADDSGPKAESKDVTTQLVEVL